MSPAAFHLRLGAGFCCHALLRRLRRKIPEEFFCPLVSAISPGRRVLPDASARLFSELSYRETPLQIKPRVGFLDSPSHTAHEAACPLFTHKFSVSPNHQVLAMLDRCPLHRQCPISLSLPNLLIAHLLKQTYCFRKVYQRPPRRHRGPPHASHPVSLLLKPSDR